MYVGTELFERQGAILLARSDGCSVWQFRSGTGDGTMTVYDVFPGTMLSVTLGLAPFYCMYELICLFVAGTATAAGVVRRFLWALAASIRQATVKTPEPLDTRAFASFPHFSGSPEKPPLTTRLTTDSLDFQFHNRV